jgi:hypothetical protein
MEGSAMGLNSGYGSGYGDGSGYGYSDGYEIHLGKSEAWQAYHYIKRKKNNVLVMRSGQEIAIGQDLHESEIKMCEYGLHASLCPDDAHIYTPSRAVLTSVLVWGRIILQKDKLVATNRRLIKILQ